MKPVRVLIVDDSARARRQLTKILEEDPGIEVCGTACDPYDARTKIKALNPDVLTLDIEMPKMDGITFLRNIMRLHPMPVIMITPETESCAGINRQAMYIGAYAFITRPADVLEDSMNDFSKELVSKVRTAPGTLSNKQEPGVTSRPKSASCNQVDAVIKKTETGSYTESSETLIAIGASTGGTEAIKEILERLPENSPAVVIAQHISIPFSTHFARRMDNACALTVHEAKDGQKILPGNAYIAPGNMHLMLEQDGDGYRCRLAEGPPVNYHTPSVDVLFRSAAQTAGPAAISVLLTGMGKDGSQGMKEMHEAGAATIVQDEQTSVVWGMPGSAVKLGVADHVLPVENIAGMILSLCSTSDIPQKKLSQNTR